MDVDIDNGKVGVTNGNARTLESRARPLPGPLGVMGKACEVATALDAFSRLPSEEVLDDEPIIGSASFLLGTRLDALREEPCETLADLLNKYEMFRRLEELLPLSDSRLQVFAHGLLSEMAIVLRTPAFLHPSRI